jgi:hypothetical protein
MTNLSMVLSATGKHGFGGGDYNIDGAYVMATSFRRLLFLPPAT